MDAPRHAARGLYWKALLARTRLLAVGDISGPLLVVAPHQDDETLGCGGLVALARRAAVPVHVLFLSDGAGPNWKLVERETMAAAREAEAREACSALGIDDHSVSFAGLPGAYLHQHRAEAAAALRDALEETKPRTVFVTPSDDGHEDHSVAARAVLRDAAVQRGGIAVYGYPIWAWRHWPWVPAAPRLPWHRRPDPRRNPSVAARPIGRAFGGARLIAAVDTRIDVSGGLEAKRQALSRYRSQVEQPPGDASWQTLDDTGRGEFVPRFFTGYEFFVRYPLSPKSRHPARSEH